MRWKLWLCSPDWPPHLEKSSKLKKKNNKRKIRHAHTWRLAGSSRHLMNPTYFLADGWVQLEHNRVSHLRNYILERNFCSNCMSTSICCFVNLIRVSICSLFKPSSAIMIFWQRNFHSTDGRISWKQIILSFSVIITYESMYFFLM